MENFKSIVVGVDLDATGNYLSDGSKRALLQAEWLAVRNGSDVYLTHATNGDRYVESHEGQWSLVHEGVSKAGMAEMEAAAERLRSMEVYSEISLREEKPFLAIVKEAQQRHADLVILGKHDEQRDGPRLGSVAVKVMRKCPTPVWVTKPGTEVAPRVIVAATDLSVVGGRAVSYAAFIAKEFHSELHVVHAFQVSMEAQLTAGRGSPVEVKELERIATAGVRAQLAGLEFEKQPILHVGCDSPSRALLAADEKLRPDLFVMGTVSRGGIPGFLVGNTAERVLPKLRGSLLVVKPEDFVSPI